MDSPLFEIDLLAFIYFYLWGRGLSLQSSAKEKM